MIPVLFSVGAPRTPPVSLDAFNIIGAAETSPTDAIAEFRVTSGGDLERRIDSGSWVFLSTWLDRGSAADYDVKLTVTSGALTTGLETQQNCGSTRTWTVVETTNGTAESSAQFTLELFYAGDSVAISTLTGRQLVATVEA